MYRPVDPKTQLPEIEEKYLEYWKKKDIFKRSIENRKDGEKFVLFDGPPFANGLPHYGHILAQSLKDSIARYATMRGYYVPRVNGWDCHGLPVEYEVEKKLELKGRKEIEEMGIETFNEKCRESVFHYTEQWQWLFDRIGRWVDQENGYATLNVDYMESIWWVFKQIWDKGLIYQGHKSMHICPRCVTPLSNFEVSQGYADVTDLSVTAMFKKKDEENTYFLAWTTTPWTLPANTALAINPIITYVKVNQGGKSYILAKELLEAHFDLDGLEIEEIPGEDLVGIEYEPLFDYYKNAELEGIENAWRVIAADFVTIDSGTGIVHIAGGYGEDDMKAVQENKMPIIKHVGMDGCFAEEVTEWAGKFVKGQDQNIAKYLEEKDQLFKKENYRHSYPHCWRCDTPLLNYATEAWFVRVTEIKDRLLENNQKIHWQPEHIKEGRFGRWLENVRDWNISRNRFWGTPLPIWKCDSCDHAQCIGSLDELQTFAGSLPKRKGEVDLHRPYIDEVTASCSKCDGEMHRIPEVLDCWFESGSMPYAQLHYPFENKEEFENNFPAQFIAEGLDQTRGWFYTLHVISTILFDKPAFQNVIVNGILLAEDGEKLSKRKRNYPDPKLLFDEKGADSTRMFFFTSTTPLAEDARFSDKIVDELMKKFSLTLWNTYGFFVTYANIDEFKGVLDHNFKPTHKLDRWILSELQLLILEVTEAMDEYNLCRASRPLLKFVDQLSNWYVRRSRRRFWKSESDEDKRSAYQTLFTVLVEFSKLLAPFMPFISDEIYRNLTGEDSVHLADWPTVNREWISEDLNREIELARLVVNLGHASRGKEKIKVRQPLAKVQVGLPDSVNPQILLEQKEVILEELNVKELEIIEDAGDLAKQVAIPNAKKLGPKYGKDVQKIIVAAKSGDFELLESGQIQIGEFTLEPDEIELAYKGREGQTIESQDGVVVALDLQVTEELKQEGLVRDLIRYIQELRKEADFDVSDRIVTRLEAEGQLELAITHFADMIKSETLSMELIQDGDLEAEIQKDFEIEGLKVKISIKRP